MNDYLPVSSHWLLIATDPLQVFAKLIGMGSRFAWSMHAAI